MFRAHDAAFSKVTETKELVYIVKNNVSDVRIINPDITAFIPKLAVGQEIRGQITDWRGIKPGYPQIKIWKSGEAEPGDEGWGTLFLVGYDDPNGAPAGGVSGQGFYADRYTLPVVRGAQFIFKLDEFTIDPLTRQIKYTVSSGNRVPLELGKQYLFKIKTSDTFFDENMLPIDPPAGETDIIGYYPPLNSGLYNEDPFSPNGDPVSFLLISSAETFPEVYLDNEDIENSLGPNALITTPNIWITETISRKIAVGRAGRNDFRLQIFTKHPDSIEKAVLIYKHDSSGRVGFLKWDDINNSNFDYINPANEYTKASQGYLGIDGISSKYGIGKRFTFTADSGLLENNPANIYWYNKPIFTSSPEPYYLEVTVTALGGSQHIQRYVLYIDGEGPMVRILTVKGAVYEPIQNYDPTADDIVIDSPYTVNGNIQVAISAIDNISNIMAYKDLPITDPNYMGINPGIAGYPMIKWVVEEDLADYLDTTINSNTILAKLKAYRNDPTKAGLSFFENIGETTMSGWIKLPTNTGNIEDNFYNFKFNTNEWDKKHMWIYIIAQDGVGNLGYILQKIYVDDDAK